MRFRLLAGVSKLSPPIFLELIDSRAEPAVDFVLHPMLVQLPIQRIDCFTGGVERDVMTRYSLFAILRWNKIDKQTLAAGTRFLRIRIVQTNWRVLEDGCRFPR